MGGSGKKAGHGGLPWKNPYGMASDLITGRQSRNEGVVSTKETDPKLTYSKDQTPSKESQRRMKVARRNLNGETGLITSSLLSGYKKPAI